MELKSKKLLVVGLARSGMALARFANARGAIVTTNDSKTEPQLEQEIRDLRDLMG